MHHSKKPFGRVDIQVSILTAVMVLVSSLCIFFLCYSITYADMIKSLQDRVTAIYTYIEASLDMQTFQTINTKEDMQNPVYQSSKTRLEIIRDATGVMYLYTAKRTPDGRLIYVVDGLDYSASDFRYPGDAIEGEIQQDLNNSLAGQTILPSKIKKTEWGKIFISYLPVHDGDEIVGAVGIEFEAEHQYNTYRALKILTPIISILFCLIAVLFAIYIFQRISNPNFQDMSNTDNATQLKNRNAFDVDLHNLMVKNNLAHIGLIVVDLNDLKKVNDTRGHAVGDEYIILTAKVLIECQEAYTVFYRIGGDEFAGVFPNATTEKLAAYLHKVHASIEQNQAQIGMPISLSAGFAIFDPQTDQDLTTTYQRADAAMYEHKRLYKASKQQ